MTRKELCEMCTEYSADTKCENKDTCKLQTILTENSRLKAEIKEYRRKNNELEARRRWDMFPDMMGK